MFDLLIIGNFHQKNRHGLNMMLTKYNIKFKYGSENDINNYENIYSPSYPIDPAKYKNKKFIFGPHFSTFPNDSLRQINNMYGNSIYIQPSEWARNVWIIKKATDIIPVKFFAFPVDMEKFKPIDRPRDKVFVYFKRRQLSELKVITNLLEKIGIEYKIFDYIKRYEEEDYLQYLQQCKYGIILDAHESQGFAIEEALSCNVPLLVWNTKYMSQEVGGKYNDIPCTTIPYWDERCGHYFYEGSELDKSFDIFIDNLESYNPREYIQENLSVDVCFKKLVELYENI